MCMYAMPMLPCVHAMSMCSTRLLLLGPRLLIRLAVEKAGELAQLHLAVAVGVEPLDNRGDLRLRLELVHRLEHVGHLERVEAAITVGIKLRSTAAC